MFQTGTKKEKAPKRNANSSLQVSFYKKVKITQTTDCTGASQKFLKNRA